ncbi:MAG: insulinase family protein, partial [Elusimicrobia bacterium]|nr:insulinase family protein [Candidatus Obscuribacterium magneticum]
RERDRVRSFLILPLIFVFILSAPLFARPPEIGPYPPLDYRPPRPERVVLHNGIIVYLLEDHELPLFDMTLRMRVSPGDEPMDRPGALGFMGTQWRAGGTISRTPEKLNEELEFLSASVETGADFEGVSIGLSCLTKDVGRVMGIFQDVLYHPAFREEKLNLAKAKALEDLKSKNDTLYSISRRAFRDVVLGPKHIYARDLAESEIKKIRRQDMAALYRRVVAPDEAMMYVSGDFKAGELLGRLENIFEGWTRAGRRVPDYDYSTVTPRTGRLFFVAKDFNQSRIVMGRIGLSRHDPDHFSMEVANTVLGGGGSSRLFADIRSRLGLAYVVGSFSIEPKGPGLAGVVCQSKADSTVAALEALEKELDQFTREEPSAEEISLAQDSLVNSFVFRFNSAAQIVSERASIEYDGYPSDYLDTYTQKIRKVGPPDILNAAKKYFSKEGMKIVIVGDKTKFDAPLSSVGEVIEIPLRDIK